MSKENTPCTCLSIIMLDSVIKAKKKYYPQTFLEECKYKQKRIKIENLIDYDLKKANLIVILTMKQNLILTMMNITNKF